MDKVRAFLLSMAEYHPIYQSKILIVSERILILMELSCLYREIFDLRNLAIQPIAQIYTNPCCGTICDISDRIDHRL